MTKGSLSVWMDSLQTSCLIVIFEFQVSDKESCIETSSLQTDWGGLSEVKALNMEDHRRGKLSFRHPDMAASYLPAVGVEHLWTEFSKTVSFFYTAKYFPQSRVSTTRTTNWNCVSTQNSSHFTKIQKCLETTTKNQIKNKIISIKGSEVNCDCHDAEPEPVVTSSSRRGNNPSKTSWRSWDTKSDCDAGVCVSGAQRDL